MPPTMLNGVMFGGLPQRFDETSANIEEPVAFCHFPPTMSYLCFLCKIAKGAILISLSSYWATPQTTAERSSLLGQQQTPMASRGHARGTWLAALDAKASSPLRKAIRTSYRMVRLSPTMAARSRAGLDSSAVSKASQRPYRTAGPLPVVLEGLTTELA